MDAGRGVAAAPSAKKTLNKTPHTNPARCPVSVAVFCVRYVGIACSWVIFLNWKENPAGGHGPITDRRQELSPRRPRRLETPYGDFFLLAEDRHQARQILLEIIIPGSHVAERRPQRQCRHAP